MPDLDIATPNGPTRVFALMHQAQPLLLQGGGPELDAPNTDRLRHIHATYSGPWLLPVVGEVAPPTAVLVRPDGHVAWVGENSAAGLTEAVTTWCGR